MIKLHCTNARKKSYNFTVVDGKLFADDCVLENIQKVYYFPCTLTEGDTEIVVRFSSPSAVNNKTELYLRRNWCSQPTGKFTEDEDDKAVAELNASVLKLFDGHDVVTLTNGFDGRVEKTFDMSTVFVADNCLVSPNAKMMFSLDACNAVFLERVTSYTRTFDVTFVTGDVKIFSISSVQRKLHMNAVKDAFQKYGVYETGPDPIPWPLMLKRKTVDNLTWKQMHELISGGDNTSGDDESEWEEGDTDAEEELDDDEEEEDYPSEGCNTDDTEELTDDSDDELADCNDDYDAWESSGQPAKKRRPNPIALPSSDDYTVVAQILTEVVDKVVEQH